MESIFDRIGGTPTVELCRLENGTGLFAKLEYLNPYGSIKDRAAMAMLDGAISRGELRDGGEVVAATSGNLGIALSGMCAARGYGCVIVMPENMPRTRGDLVRAYGARLLLTSAAGGMSEACEVARNLARESGALYIDQFTNRDGMLIHTKTTATELDRQMNGELGAVVCGIGTGATACGIAKYFSGRGVEVIGVEPAASPVLTQGRVGSHKIFGIGAGFVPPLLDRSIVKRIVAVEDGEALEARAELARREGIFAGISSGAALAAAIRLAKVGDLDGKNITIILPDSGERYL